MILLQAFKRWWDWRQAWKTPAPPLRSVPADLHQSRLEVWQFAKQPSGQPRRPWVCLDVRQGLGARVENRSMVAFHRDHPAAHIEVITSRTPLPRALNEPTAWTVEQARQAAQQILAQASQDQEVWILEHTTLAPGVRVHHARGVWTLFPDTPPAMLSAEMLAQAGQWLWTLKRRELDKRPPLSPLRASLTQGRQAMEQALDNMRWDWAAVMDVIDVLHDITHPVEPYFLPQSPWYSTAPLRQKAWLDIDGTFGDRHEWQENASTVEAVQRLCKAIPDHLVSVPILEPGAPTTDAFGLEPWNGFSRVLEHLHYWIVPWFWLAHRDPVSLWTDPRAADYWGAAFGTEHFQAGDIDVFHCLQGYPHDREDKGHRPLEPWENPHGCVDFLTVPLDMFHQEWGKRLFPQLPQALQHQALDEALWRIRPDNGSRRLANATEDERKHFQWLKQTAPHWPGWQMAEWALDDYPAYRAHVREKALTQRLPFTDGPQVPTERARL